MFALSACGLLWAARPADRPAVVLRTAWASPTPAHRGGAAAVRAGDAGVHLLRCSRSRSLYSRKHEFEADAYAAAHASAARAGAARWSSSTRTTPPRSRPTRCIRRSTTRTRPRRCALRGCRPAPEEAPWNRSPRRSASPAKAASRRSAPQQAGELLKAAQGLAAGGRQTRQDLPVRELLPDHGLRERAGLDLAPRGPPSRPRGRLQPVPRRATRPTPSAACRRTTSSARPSATRCLSFDARSVVPRVFSSFDRLAAHHTRNLLEAAGIAP